jgi:hypothetical protein
MRLLLFLRHLQIFINKLYCFILNLFFYSNIYTILDLNRPIRWPYQHQSPIPTTIIDQTWFIKSIKYAYNLSSRVKHLALVLISPSSHNKVLPWHSKLSTIYLCFLYSIPLYLFHLLAIPHIPNLNTIINFIAPSHHHLLILPNINSFTTYLWSLYRLHTLSSPQIPAIHHAIPPSAPQHIHILRVKLQTKYSISGTF